MVRQRALALLTCLSCAEVILVLRIYAMYGGNKLILWGLLAILCGRIVAELVIIGPIIAQGQGEPRPVLPF